MIDVRAEKQWLTTQEVEREALPGCPSSRELRRMMADRKIAWRPRKAAGGGREFHWSSLPAQARDEYLRRYGVTSQQLPSDPSARAAAKDMQAEARALVVEAFEAFLAARPVAKSKALKSFCKAFAARRVKLDAWVFETVTRIAPHQLPLWARRAREGSLLDGRGRPSGSGLFDLDLALRNYTVAAIAARPHLAATHLKGLIATDLGRDIPLRTLQHFIRNFRKSAAPELKALTNPDRYRSHHKPAFGVVGARVECINALWEIDASPADAMCLVDGREMRVKLVGVIDVFTRRAMVLVSDQVRGLATMALVRRAILAWGLPETLKIDNGKEFKNRAVERFCQDLSITTSFSKPFHPEQKPHIERFFGTLNRGLFELLPGYIGHNVAERSGIEARKSFAHRFGEDAQLAFGVQLSPEGLQARVDQWCEQVYAQTPHEGIGLTPAAKAIAHADQARRLSDERLLDALMLDAPDASGLRVVGKSGIRIGNRFYVSGELGALMGHRVHCRFDPHEPARLVVYTADRSQFVCVAEDRERLDDPRLAAIAAEAQAINRRKISDIRSATRKVQKLYPADGAADRLLLSGTGSFQPAPQSIDAMRLASPPKAVTHLQALDALEQSRKPESPIEPTDEDRASAEIFHLEDASKHAPPPQRMEQCNGYERPAFLGDEFGLYAWLSDHRDTLDAHDARVLAEFEADDTFQLMLKTKRRARA